MTILIPCEKLMPKVIAIVRNFMFLRKSEKLLHSCTWCANRANNPFNPSSSTYISSFLLNWNHHPQRDGSLQLFAERLWYLVDLFSSVSYQNRQKYVEVRGMRSSPLASIVSGTLPLHVTGIKASFVRL